MIDFATLNEAVFDAELTDKAFRMLYAMCNYAAMNNTTTVEMHNGFLADKLNISDRWVKALTKILDEKGYITKTVNGTSKNKNANSYTIGRKTSEKGANFTPFYNDGAKNASEKAAKFTAFYNDDAQKFTPIDAQKFTPLGDDAQKFTPLGDDAQKFTPLDAQKCAQKFTPKKNKEIKTIDYTGVYPTGMAKAKKENKKEKKTDDMTTDVQAVDAQVCPSISSSVDDGTIQVQAAEGNNNLDASTQQEKKDYDAHCIGEHRGAEDANTITPLLNAVEVQVCPSISSSFDDGTGKAYAVEGHSNNRNSSNQRENGHDDAHCIGEHRGAEDANTITPLLNAVEVGTQHGSDNLITSTSCSNGLSNGSIFTENCPNETPTPNSAHPLPLKNAAGGHETRGAVQQTAQGDKTPQEANLEAKTAFDFEQWCGDFYTTMRIAAKLEQIEDFKVSMGILSDLLVMLKSQLGEKREYMRAVNDFNAWYTVNVRGSAQIEAASEVKNKILKR